MTEIYSLCRQKLALNYRDRFYDKKLARYDRWHFTEVDQICLKKKSTKTQRYFFSKTPANDPYEIHTKLLPILEACIRDEITKPFEDNNELISGNYLWDKREGFLPSECDAEFNSAFNRFSFAAESMVIDKGEEIIKDGVTYAYMEFEEPGDWPDLVLKLEDERRWKPMGSDYISVNS